MSEFSPSTGDRAAPHAITIMDPPRTVRGILRRLGPGLIIAGSIVGSGELIATTLTGATAGFWLLWLIVIGCIIKVFVQVEFGRYTISSGETTIGGLNQVPGPVADVNLTGIAGGKMIRGNWILWYWLAMFFVSLGQLGGIVGGVGQAIAISVPLTERGRAANERDELTTQRSVLPRQIAVAERRLAETDPDARTGLQSQLEGMRGELAAGEARLRELEAAWPAPAASSAGAAPSGWDQFVDQATTDDKIWAAIITLVTIVILIRGRYGLIQSFSTVLVASFTLVTVVNLFALQFDEVWAIRADELWDGLKLRLTPDADVRLDAKGEKLAPLWIALATFGIIGVGANELIAYPYWCQEKGYARFTGPRDETPAWAARARGWLRVLRWDAWCSMVVYTFATVAFYLLGAAILWRVQLVPEGMQMIRTLGVMYEPVFGAWAKAMFLFGAFAVLYSTFFVANAGHARIASDALGVLGFTSRSERTRARAIAIMCALFPALSLLIYLVFPRPTVLVLAGGAMQAFMLPLLAVAALYFRYRRCDRRIAPGPAWDVMLWISAAGLIVAGAWLLIETLLRVLGG